MTVDESQAIVDRWYQENVPLDMWLKTSTKSAGGVRIIGFLRNVDGEFVLAGAKGSFIVFSPFFVRESYGIGAEVSDKGTSLIFYYDGVILRLSDFSENEKIQ